MSVNGDRMMRSNKLIQECDQHRKTRQSDDQKDEQARKNITSKIRQARQSMKRKNGWGESKGEKANKTISHRERGGTRE